MNNQKIKVLVVDDSPVARDLLTFIIESDPLLQVIGYAPDGQAALKILEHETPDVITMDIFMPKLDGFETTRKIMETRPIPIIIISASYNPSQVEKSFLAIDAGALAIIPKPAGPGDPLFLAASQEIIETIKTVHGVKLVKRHQKPSPSPIYSPYLVETKADEISDKSFLANAVAIGSSLGGPPALATILSELPASFPVPIFIVQHIAIGFAQGLADWLNTQTKLSVKIAVDHEKARPGWIYLGPEKYHMEISSDNVINFVEPTKEEKLFPSVAHLFYSMAHAHGPHGVGVILTGMGKDGAAELLIMKKNGAFTIAQDEEGCIMFGMPKEAIELQAARRVVPLPKIATLLKQLVQNRG